MRHALVPILALALVLISGTEVTAKGRAPSTASAGTHVSSKQPPQIRRELNRGYVFLKRGNVTTALSCFQRVLRWDPKNRVARLELGYINARLEHWQEAAEYLSSVSKREPNNLRLRMDLGYALQKAGNLKAAAQQFSTVALLPGDLQSQAAAALVAVQPAREDNFALRSIAATENVDEVKALGSRRNELLNEGYSLLREGNRSEAQRRFELALAEDPTYTTTLKQLGYMALESGDLPTAVARFEIAQQQAPQDYPVILQLGFIYAQLQQTEKARAAFRAATESPEQKVRINAATALKNLEAANRHWYGEVFASPFYSARFNNGIAYGHGKLAWKPALTLPLSFYLGARVTRDSRSQGGNLPQIFSDNVGLFGIGISLQPRRYHFNITAEANAAFNFVPRTGENWRIRPDYRAVLGYYRRWDGKLAERAFTDVDSSFGYYSRYRDNFIAYLQLRQGLQLFDLGQSRFYGYLKGDLVKDTNSDFYNNLGEGGAGLEFRPFRTQNLGLRLEYLRGAYFGIEGRDKNPFRPNYNDFRMTLIYGRRF